MALKLPLGRCVVAPASPPGGRTQIDGVGKWDGHWNHHRSGNWHIDPSKSSGCSVLHDLSPDAKPTGNGYRLDSRNTVPRL